MRNISKQELRKKTLIKRIELEKNGTIEQISNIIVNKIVNSNDFKTAQNIALYYPIKGEINLLKLLKIESKNFYFPNCTSSKMEFFEYRGEFKNGKYNIPTSTGKKISPEEIDLFLIPALALNLQNYRLGYGAGYYDKFFLENKTKAKKIAVVPSLFTKCTFEVQKHDIPMDEIITEIEY